MAQRPGHQTGAPLRSPRLAVSVGNSIPRDAATSLESLPVRREASWQVRMECHTRSGSTDVAWGIISTTDSS